MNYRKKYVNGALEGGPRRSKWGLKAQNGVVKAQNGAVEWRVCRPVVADLHHFDKEQDPDPQKLDPDLH
jgi:hypothetical protein